MRGLVRAPISFGPDCSTLDGRLRRNVSLAGHWHRAAVPVKVEHRLLASEPSRWAVYDPDDRMHIHQESDSRRVDDPGLNRFNLCPRVGRRLPAVRHPMPEPIRLMKHAGRKLRPVKLDVTGPTIAGQAQRHTGGP